MDLQNSKQDIRCFPDRWQIANTWAFGTVHAAFSLIVHGIWTVMATMCLRLKRLVPAVAAFLIIGCGSKEEVRFVPGSPKDTGKFVFPPEWEPHQAVWIDFSDQRGWYFKDQEARIEIIKALHKFVPVKVLVNHEYAHHVLDSMMELANIDTSKITVFKNTKFSGASVRDSGPIFLSNGDSLKIADFRWSSYAESLMKWNYVVRWITISRLYLG